MRQLVNLSKPPMPGVGEDKSSKRVTLFAALCTHCGVSNERYRTRKKAFQAAQIHQMTEHKRVAT